MRDQSTETWACSCDVERSRLPFVRPWTVRATPGLRLRSANDAGLRRRMQIDGQSHGPGRWASRRNTELPEPGLCCAGRRSERDYCRDGHHLGNNRRGRQRCVLVRKEGTMPRSPIAPAGRPVQGLAGRPTQRLSGTLVGTEERCTRSRRPRAGSTASATSVRLWLAVSRPKCNTRVIGLRAQLDESRPGFERRPATA